MKLLLCATNEAIETAVTRALADHHQGFLTASDPGGVIKLMQPGVPTVVLVAGSSSEAVARACSQLRMADLGRDIVIVAVVTRPEDARAPIEAGADECFIESDSEEVLRNRLLVARRTARRIVSRRQEEYDRTQFFHLSLQLLCITGFDGYFKMINPGWTEALGWSSAELISKPVLDLVHPDDREATLAEAKQLETGHAVAGFANRFRCKEGGYLWMEWQSAPLVDRGIVYSVVRDITEAKRTKEALREVSESLATTLDSIGDGVIAMDLTGAITRMNPVAEKLTGWTLDEAKGHSVLEVLPLIGAKTRAKVESPFEHALREQAVVKLPRNTLLQRRDGSEIPIADSCAPIRSNEGKLSGAVLVFRDLSAQQDAEAHQAELQRQLVFADRMASVGTLAAGVAHEINNPLSYVAANVDMAVDEVALLRKTSASPKVEELDEMLREAREGITRVTKIVRGLKTFSRIEEERRTVIDLIPVIELSISMAFNEIRHRARLVKDFGRLPLVDADDARLGQVFINLLVNAAHAFPEGNMDAHEIRIITSTDGVGRAVIEVRDTGSGIPPALLDRVFDPFFTTKAIGVGTGLGLAISHNIVTGMGGEISVHSEVGHGTTFRVTLPPSSSREMPAATKSNGSKPPQTRPASVLVVDDEAKVGSVIRRALRGHEVTVVTAAQDALDLIDAGKDFDVVLSDLMMPGVSGMELYRSLLCQHPNVAARVVFVTGGAFTPEANAFLDEVSNERIEKPFDYQKLRAMIQKFAN